MKKLMLLAVLMVSQMTFAQLPWNEIRAMYDDVYKLAENVGDQTNRVIAEETKSEDQLQELDNRISLVKTSGAVTFRRELDPEMPVEFYKYTLVKADGTAIPLVEKMLVEKVIEKYEGVLNRLKETLRKDRDTEVKEILSILDDL